MPLLSVRGLTLALKGGSNLVRNVRLDIEQGEIHGLIGESGSGKSLTALSIARLLPPGISIGDGNITLDISDSEQVVSDLTESQMRKLRGSKIGFVFQDPMTSLNPSMRCGEQIGEVLREHLELSGTGLKNEILRLLEKVKIADPSALCDAYPHEISGGQRQRVMIAIAVACKPRLLIADEPTTALDVTVQRKIVELINELRISDGLAVLFISHDIGLVSSIAQNISIMYRGEIVESGATEMVLNSPKHPYTRGLISCRPPKDGSIRRLRTVEDVVQGNDQVEIPKVRPATIPEKSVLLEVRDVEKHFYSGRVFSSSSKSSIHVLKGINFEVFRGESLALIGESGSGKSTLARIILMLTDADSGKLRYNGKDFPSHGSSEQMKLRGKIQMIFQDPYSALNPKIKAGHAIVEAMSVHGIGNSRAEREKKTREYLQKVGLKDKDFYKYPHQFSGGQRQRIVIARALCVEPEFIVCDEAVSSLDVSVQARILNLLLDLKDELGLTYLFISHDMSVVRFFCDRLLVMKGGEIVESGQCDDVFNKPSSPFTQELISAIY